MLPEILALLVKAMLECISEIVVDPSPALEILELPAKVPRLSHESLKEIHGTFALIRPHTLQEVIEDNALCCGAHAAPQIKGGAGRKGEIVHPVRLEVVDLPWQKPQSPSPDEPPTSDLKPANVLSRDLCVGADVHDVNLLDSVVTIPKMVDCLRDQSSRHQCLPEPDLVSHQEATGRVRRRVEPLEGVLYGVALETLESTEDSFGVGTPTRSLWAHALSAFRAAHTGAHMSCRPSGRRFFPSGVFSRSAINRAASSIRLGL